MLTFNYQVIGYNTKGEVLEVESGLDQWSATEICLELSDQHGYAEQIDGFGYHCGEYGDRPVGLGQRTY